ncbi:MAG: hypothetical protein QOJ92_88 [Frankiales bacterium]|nr:hypothetical protein [Frankiales bacterium]
MTFTLDAVVVILALLTWQTLVNGHLMRRPPAEPAGQVTERVSVLLPVRDEAHRVVPCLRALHEQTGISDGELLVLDDGSKDGTAEVVLRELPGARLLVGAPLPDGWLGKPFACQQLADAASGDVLVFLDADVVLAPDGIARTVALLRSNDLGFVSPYPRQRACSWAERLVQPLLQWSWLTFLPLRRAERSPRLSLAAANGQLLAVDAALYRAAGGHLAVRDEVLDDIALARRLRASGVRGGFADGSGLARCRMYSGWRELRAGYAKSLWTAFGSPGRGLAAALLMIALYVAPLAALGAGRGKAAGIAYGLGVVGRWSAAGRTGGRRIDALLHPVSVLLFGWLVAASVLDHRRGRLTWKGRPILAGARQ